MIWPRYCTLALALVALSTSCKRTPPANPTPATEPAVEAPAPAEPSPSVNEQAETETGPPPEPGPPSLADELRRAADGAPVVLVLGERSLLAFDGAETRELAPLTAPVDSSMIGYDPAHELLWYVDGSTLRALDLHAPPGPPIEVVTGLPEDPSLALPDAGLWLGYERVPEYFLLTWSEQAELGVESTWDEIINEEILDDLAKMTIVDGARSWLTELAARSPRAVPESPAPTHLDDVPVEGCDADESTCGTAVAYPGNPAWLIYVDSFDCGDYCYWSCTLWNRDTGQTADPSELPTPRWDADAKPKTGSCGTFFTAAASQAFTASGQRCDADGCVDLPGVALGFVDPGPTVIAGP